MNWNSYINGYKSFLKLEKSLSDNSIDGYLRDVRKLSQYFENENLSIHPPKITLSHLQDFIHTIHNLGLSATSQARIISGIRGFFKYLLLENIIQQNPTELLELPKTTRTLPDTLSIYEIEKLLNTIELGTPEGQRNRAIIETLYGCGLRVSELTDLKLSQILDDGNFVKVLGKGSKERLVPLGSIALKYINLYIEQVRIHISIKKGQEDYIFLNRRGSKLSRVMIFTIIKKLALQAEIKKNIHPHTFRHSFATHLIEGGADLRAIQEMLGHESITTTEIYTHLTRDYLRDTILHFHPRNKK